MMQAPTKPPYLFFSYKCPHCKQLIELIKRNQSLARRIEPIDVHTARYLPPQLDGVPAILVNGQLLVGPDTFKWVQMASASDQNRAREQQQGGGMPGGGMPGGGMPGGMPGGMLGGNEDDGLPMPSDISADTKHGIDFTPLPGQDFSKSDPTIPRFSYLPGSANQANGFNGIDYATATDPDLATKGKGNGVIQQLERLNQMRDLENDKLRGQVDANMMYSGGGMGSGPGFAGPMGSPMGGMSSQMQMGQQQQGYNQGYNQGMGQQGYNQGMGQQAYIPPPPMQMQNNYELQSGQRGGYSTQYQQQNGNQSRGDDSLPKRF